MFGVASLQQRKLWSQGQGGLLEMVNKLIFGRIGGCPLDSFKVVSPRTPLESSKVAWLLDKEKRSWDVSKVRSPFLPHEADTILWISISPRLLNDSLSWA